MKPREIPHIHKIPFGFKKLFWLYTIKKLFRLTLSNQEKEANLFLRILSRSTCTIKEINNHEIRWLVRIGNTSLEALTRRYPSSDLAILHQVMAKNEYGPAIDLLKAKKIAGNDVKILDAGANVGLSSLFFKAHFHQAQILAIEIDSGNFEQIQKNINQPVFDSIHPIRDAMWKRTSYLRIKTDFRDQSECSFYVEESEEKTDLVGHDIQHFMKKMNWDFIDLLKIDIEGAERYLFEDKESADKLLSITNILAIEIHDEFNIRPSIYEHLRRNGFAYFNHGDLTIAHR